MFFLYGHQLVISATIFTAIQPFQPVQWLEKGSPPISTLLFVNGVKPATAPRAAGAMGWKHMDVDNRHQLYRYKGNAEIQHLP
jgi:hypothetical protein